MARKRTKSEDEELEPSQATTAGSHQAAGGSEDATTSLIDLLKGVTELREYLLDLDAKEWRVVDKRLQRFREAVAALPTSPASRRKIGFGES